MQRRCSRGGFHDEQGCNVRVLPIAFFIHLPAMGYSAGVESDGRGREKTEDVAERDRREGRGGPTGCGAAENKPV